MQICDVISGIFFVHRSALQTVGCGPAGERSVFANDTAGLGQGPQRISGEVLFHQPTVGSLAIVILVTKKTCVLNNLSHTYTK